MLDLGKMQEVPPEAQVLLEQVETTEAYRTEPLTIQVQRYLHPEHGETVVCVTVDLSQTARETRPAVVARFAPADAELAPRVLGEESFRIVESPARRVAQGRLVLPAGQYALTVLVADPARTRTGLHRAEVRVPSPSDRMRLSDVAWADELESVEYAALASYDEPFVVGPFHVTPRLDSAYRQGDTVKLFFEVYGAALPLQVSYQVEGREDDGRWVPLGRPSVAERAEISLGWEIPTTVRWPSGEYRVRVEVRDQADHMVSTLVPFVLQEAEPSATAAEPAAGAAAPE
jgi:hypothetical protein